MKNVLLQAAMKLNTDRKKRKWLQRTVRAMAMVVVFCTTYALILPAITMEGKPECGMEAHTHTEDCYTMLTTSEFQCELGEQTVAEHSHGTLCYNALGEMICLLPEIEGHTHESGCYNTAEIVTTENVLTCELPESEGHTHVPECFTTGEVLSCELPESEEHTHGAECFTTGEVLSCQLPESEGHTHVDTCCTTEETVLTEEVLICGLAETVLHVHTESCLVETQQKSLICGIPEHIHEDTCYPVEESGETQREYLCGSGVHTHVEHCYTEDGTLACTIPEHAHVAACLIEDLDLNADAESQAEWEEELSKLSLTGNWAKDVLTVAESQLDYHESVKNVILEDDQLKGYTRYGEWYGIPYGDWCAMYASFCLHYAGVENFPLESEVNRWIEALTEQELYVTSEVYTAKPGDLIFFDHDQVKDAAEEIPVDADHVGIVVELIPASETEPAKIRTIEGNTDDQVAYVTYDMDDVTIIGYGTLPEQTFYCGMEDHYHGDSCLDESGSPACGQNPHVHDETCWNMDQSFAVNGRTLECGEDHEHTADCYGDAVARFSYEDDIVSMKITVVSATGIPRGTQLEVTDLSDESFESYFEYADENRVGELTGLVGYEFHFYLAGEEIEIEDAQITVELAVNGSLNNFETGVVLMSMALEEEDGSEEEEEPAGTLTILSENGGVVTSGESMESTGTPGTVTFTIQGRSVALMSESAAVFTVEYYAHFPMFQYYDDNNDDHYEDLALEIINTSGKKLPVNGSGYLSSPTENEVLFLMLRQTTELTNQQTPDTSDPLQKYVYEVLTEMELTEVYTNETYSYFSGMGVHDVGKLHENSHYELSDILVSYDNGATWTVYTEEGISADEFEGYEIANVVTVEEIHDLSFTNNSANEDMLLIKDGAIIRMVHNLLTGTQNVSANIFDYDISDTKVYVDTNTSTSYYNLSQSFTSAQAALNFVTGTRYEQAIYMKTTAYGINAATAYIGNGSSIKANTTYFAFGNSNTGVTHRADTLNGYKINAANTNTFKYCSFGIVTGYDAATDSLIFANSIVHQPLFNDSADFTGKTTYARQVLNFERTGDTYVLQSVNGGNDMLGNGVTESQLDKFITTGMAWKASNSTLPDDRLFTNNFWPLDGTITDSTTGHDMLFGDENETVPRKYYGDTSVDSNGIANLPDGDDGNAHNSYFGMQFAVEFEIDGDYCGPLEYLFFGDDDMWVFLTNVNTGETELICDIGGVHSSVGSYTNLWDYIPAGEAGVGTYKLTFFYTERGASGSCCYMEFTLPQVTSITQNTADTGSVSVTKEVEGTTTDDAFAFKFELSGDVQGINDKFAYEITGGNKTISSGTIASGETFTLTDGQTFTVMGIPEGAAYTITEQLTEEQTGYKVAWTGTQSGSGNSIAGTIQGNSNHTYTVTNQAIGSLELTKEIVGTIVDGAFAFEVTLSNGEDAVSGSFNCLSGNATSVVTFVDGKATVSLAHGQTVTITGIPAGTSWTVTEAETADYSVTYKVNGETVTTASGTIGHNETVSVKVVNATQYALPNTGGEGTLIFTFGGLLILAAATMYICESRHKRRKGGA